MAENIHDKGYKRILSDKSVFLHLLRRYINTSWLEHVDVNDLQLIDKEFIPKDFQEREADIIYKINREHGKDCYVYILLELQSKVDYTMPFRLLIYMTELMKRIFNDTDKRVRERKSFRLPPIIPIVLYNGEQPWTAIREFRHYFEDSQVFGDRLLDFTYSLVDINAQDESFLLDMNTLLENVFLLDRSQDQQSLQQALKVTMCRIQKLNRTEQLELSEWIRDVLLKKANPNTDTELIEQIIESWKKGDELMMTYGIERAFDNERKKGIEQGIEKNKKEIALKLLSLNVEIDKIVESTGLTELEIQALAKSL